MVLVTPDFDRVATHQKEQNMKNLLWTMTSVGFVVLSAFGQEVGSDAPSGEQSAASPVGQFQPAPEVTAVDVVYEELFEIGHTSSDALFMRPDIEEKVGHDLAVINLEAIDDQDAEVEAYTGPQYG